MNRILVTGGTGELGSAIVRELLQRDATIRIMSRRGRQAGDPPGVEWSIADLETGMGIVDAVAGVDTIVHAASGTSGRSGAQSFPSLWKHSRAVDVLGTDRLLKQARESSVRHVIYVSIVGMEHVPFFYYERKLAAETIVRDGSVPWTILRATQFHSFVDRIIQATARMPLVLTPTDLRFQPIATEDVARFVIWAIEAGPAGLLPNVGGPQVRTLRDLTREWLDVRRDRRRIVHLRLPGRAADAVRAGRLTCPDRAVGDLTWREWLERTYGATHEPSIRETAR